MAVFLALEEVGSFDDIPADHAGDDQIEEAAYHRQFKDVGKGQAQIDHSQQEDKPIGDQHLGDDKGCAGHKQQGQMDRVEQLREYLYGQPTAVKQVPDDD